MRIGETARKQPQRVLHPRLVDVSHADKPAAFAEITRNRAPDARSATCDEDCPAFAHCLVAPKISRAGMCILARPVCQLLTGMSATKCLLEALDVFSAHDDLRGGRLQGDGRAHG